MDNFKTGAYWMHYGEAEPTVCWIHQGKVWFAPSVTADYKYVVDYTERGCEFDYIEIPPGRPLVRNSDGWGPMGTDGREGYAMRMAGKAWWAVGESLGRTTESTISCVKAYAVSHGYDWPIPVKEASRQSGLDNVKYLVCDMASGLPKS